MSKNTLAAAALVLALPLSSTLLAQSIEITRAQERTAMRGPETAYTGVGIAEFFFRAGDASDLTAGEITFEPGARTAWHNHPAGQYLIVTSGVGWVQARGEAKQVIEAGDVVWTPPGVFHWHGASATQSMRHIAVWQFVDGSGGELAEHVGEDEYLAEARAPSRAPPLRGPVVAGAPVRVASHANPVAQLASADAALAANKRLVFDVWRSIVNGGRVELADELLAPGYIQHSPLLPTGREAFKQIFSAVPRSETIPAVVSPPLVAIVAEGDLVAMALLQEAPEKGVEPISGKGVEPIIRDGDGTYTTTHFNLFRVEDGRLAEHWHSLTGPPGPNVLAPGAGGPQRITGRRGTQQFELLESADAELARNKRLVFDLWRNVVDAGREEAADLYLAEDYVEHDPSAATGRAAFKARYARQPDRPIETSLRAPLVAMLAEGDLVVQVVMHEHAHPSREGDTYTTAAFDMYRIAGGRIAEHWNAVGEPAFAGN